MSLCDYHLNLADKARGCISCAEIDHANHNWGSVLQAILSAVEAGASYRDIEIAITTGIILSDTKAKA